MGEQEIADLKTRIAVLETKDDAQECRLNSLEIDVGKKFDRLEAKLDQVLRAAQGRPTWVVALAISGLMTVVTGLIVYLVTH
ncbi:conserved hypothetical protein [Candidatus Desulfosporosinus infrequens]|uniref:Uncharacterized protein n=1 Tax=Candidatus Desulfosporosinus infrequens TaxID=2043169 RepID=A0A2U3L5R8_9FIRM|nr:conserved hypothetical protein [Candidatus Desulfosporosinus infrequens]